MFGNVILPMEGLPLIPRPGRKTGTNFERKCHKSTHYGALIVYDKCTLQQQQHGCINSISNSAEETYWRRWRCRLNCARLPHYITAERSYGGCRWEFRMGLRGRTRKSGRDGVIMHSADFEFPHWGAIFHHQQMVDGFGAHVPKLNWKIELRQLLSMVGFVSSVIHCNSNHAKVCSSSRIVTGMRGEEGRAEHT